MSSLPAYKEACLASGMNKESVYLVGSVNTGELEVYTIDISLTDVTDGTSTFKAKDASASISWSPSLPKYCFSPTSDMSSLSNKFDLTVAQFGDNAAFMAAIGSGPPVSAAVPALAGGSPKLFALTSFRSKKEILSVYVKGDPGPDKAWRGMLLDLDQPMESKQIR